jgi:GNAT superfamily N-acetyltransferase
MSEPTPHLRQATRDDIPGIWDVRYAVQENTLRRGLISDEDVRAAIEDTGRGWVVTAGQGREARVLAFAIAVVDRASREGNVWALFVDPQAQGQGHGSALHEVMLTWLRQQDLASLWLGTGPGTQALGFYQRRGWVLCGTQQAGKDLVLEQRLEPPGLG